MSSAAFVPDSLPGSKRRSLLQSEEEDPSWPNLPVDVQALILCRLPVEKIVRLRPMCRQWSKLFSTLHFQSLWTNNNNNSNYKNTDSGPFFLLSMEEGFPVSTTRCHQYSSSDHTSGPAFVGQRLSPSILASLTSALPEEGSEPLLSAGGLLATLSKGCFWVGNPLTRQWVRIPPLRTHAGGAHRKQLLPYTSSEGQNFFKLWIDPYLFDSSLGIWTLPDHQAIEMCSFNTLQLGGVSYALGRCWQHNALVLLLALDGGDCSTLSNSTWVCAWDFSGQAFRSAYMLEVGGKIGVLTLYWKRLSLFVLELSNDVPCWTQLSTMPGDTIESFTGACCTHGKLTFVCLGNGISVFDSESVTWVWLEDVSSATQRYRMLLLEPSWRSVPCLKAPSEALSKRCASRKYADAGFWHHHIEGTFSGLDAMFKSGMTWRDIGKVAIDRNKGGVLKGYRLRKGAPVVNLKPW